MADIGCLMSDPMQRANLSGDKTVTRRIGKTWARARVGDRLWFREVWRPAVAPDDSSGYLYRCDGRFERVADTQESVDEWCRLWANDKSSTWRSSLLMPRSVCRATGIITSIGQVRLQDIDEADALREGMGTLTWADVVALKGERKACQAFGLRWQNHETSEVIRRSFGGVDARSRFWLVFCLLHSSEVWLDNPLVWRVEWRRE